MLFLDHRGPIATEIALFVEQSIPVKLIDLNSKGYADTFYIGLNGETYSAEIKQPGEVLGSLSNVEEQLARQFPNVDNLSLYIAGVIVPSDGGCRTLSWYPNGDGGRLSGLRGGLPFRQSYGGYRSWVESIERFGIRVVELPNKLALATHLVSTYQYDQKPPESHATFRHPIRTKQVMGSWQPEVLTMMGIVDVATGRTFLGPEMAKALVNGYSSVAAILNAPCEELANVQLESGRKVGKVAAGKIVAAVGRV